MRRLRSRKLLAPVLIALGALAWAGCGGGASTPTLPTSSMTNAEFANRAEAICARGRSQALRLQPVKAGQSERDALTETIQSTLLPAIQTVIDKIYSLGAPAAEKAQTEALLIAMQQAVEEGEQLEVPTVERVEELFAKSGRLARKARLAPCIYG